MGNSLISAPIAHDGPYDSPSIALLLVVWIFIASDNMTLLVDTPIFTRPADLRLAARNGSFSSPTPGQCAGYVQVNLLILPKQYADHFRELCRRNPVPCPLIAESTAPGDVTFPAGVADGIDVTTDSPGYNVYVCWQWLDGGGGAETSYYDGKLVHHDVKDVRKYWKEDSVAFLSAWGYITCVVRCDSRSVGCSLTFESALRDAGLTPRHSLLGTNVTMYRTSLKLLPGGSRCPRSSAD